MWYALGILLILLGFAGVIINRAMKAQNKPSLFSKGAITGIFILGAVLFGITGMFFWAQPGTLYAVQYWWGGDKMVATQGIKFKAWSTIIPIRYEIAIQDTIGDNPSEDDIYYRRAGNYEFSDAINADIAVTTIFNVDYTSEDAFLSMAENNRSESKLVFSRVRPVVDQALRITCKLMDAQDYIAGGAADFDRYFKDQLQNGVYRLEEYYEEEESPEIIGDTATTRVIRTEQNENSRRKKWRIMYGSDGLPMRDNSNHSLKAYGLSVVMATVVKVNWEDKFDERLDLQKEQVAQTQLEKQEAEKEFYRAQKETARGEAEKAKERARLEKEQIQKTIEAETQAKVAEYNLIEEKKQYEVAQYQAKTVRVKADAEAYQNRLLVNAGLTPQERMQMEIQKNKDMWINFKDLKLPEIYISGAEGSESGLLEQLIGADMAKQMRSKKQ